MLRTALIAIVIGVIVGGVALATASPWTDTQTASGNVTASTVFPVLPVQIDIKPGSYPNSINLARGRIIPVAILTTATFDATTVDPSTVCFGDAEQSAERACTEAHGRGHHGDVDGDGDTDLVLHYETTSTGIDPGDAQACLTGATFNSVAIEGCDSIRTLT